MIEEKEILRVAELMRIRIDDHGKYIKQVKKILEYFNTLDTADVESEDLDSVSVDIKNLRDDVYSKFDRSIIDDLKNYKGVHVRTPKMI
ncbi:MAG: aspartyl/glutamyl-tRNA amidotransferase subunit C [Cenarchaeum symbiont of Oopsacas minuta]|nr:aspartyl/glutamyl-tRNA amidotransferase subunit C [Cenarchaeum symbiont of Oopsacas minuta]